VLNRDAAGRLRYAWKPNTSPVGPGEQERLVKAGLLKPDEALLQLQDSDTGKTLYAHGGSVYWNAYRKRWTLITVERGGGPSNLGEIWYSEADTPVGPWAYARKVASHPKYSLYNPKQHPEFAKEGGRYLYFEGTYTFTFSGSEDAATPRYDYNNLMYRLDLADPRLALPVPVREHPWAKSEGTADFFAPDRPGPGLVPVFWRGAGGKGTLDTEKVGEAVDRRQAPLFYALPADAKNPPATTLPLYEWARDADGARLYSTAETGLQGYRRTTEPICRVWKNPCRVDLSAEGVTPE
jgi:hypothetical protein